MTANENLSSPIKPYILHKGTHNVTTRDGFIVIRPQSNNHMIIVSAPDSSLEPDKYFETSIYIGNHATILVKGLHKGKIQLCLKSGEYETELCFDESEGSFTRKSTYECITKKSEVTQ